MVYWNRFISYIFRYHEYDKCENTGFAKVQKQNEKGKMQVNFKDQVKKEGLYSVYLYRETLADPEEYPEAVPDSMIPVVLYLGKLSLKSGRGEDCFTFDWNNVNHTGRPITAWSGIIIRGWAKKKVIFSAPHGRIISWITVRHLPGGRQQKLNGKEEQMLQQRSMIGEESCPRR